MLRSDEGKVRGGEVPAVGAFTIADGKIVAIDILADLDRLSTLDLAAPDGA